MTARTRAAAVVVAFENVPHAPAPEKASMQPVPQCIVVTPHHPHWEQHWPYVDPAHVCVPLHCPSTEVVTPKVDDPVEAGADPVFVPEGAAGDALGLEGAAGALALGPELVVEVMKPEAVAVEEVTGMMEMAGMLAEDTLDAWVATGAGELAAGDGADGAGTALLPDVPADPAEPPPIPFTAAQVPVKPVPDFVEVPVTSGPGSGKTTSSDSTVVQPFPMFATNMPGRDEKGTVLALLVPDPAAIVMEAQFW